MGWNNFSRYDMNATSEPKVITPESIPFPPKYMSSASPENLINPIRGLNMAKIISILMVVLK